MTAALDVYTQDIVVTDADIDMQNRVSNLRYVEWMQDVAVGHSAARGWSMERYESLGQGWVVRQHTITYKRPALLGDVVTAATWIASYGPRRSLRRYAFWRAEDKALLAEAETQWVYIDMATGKPRSVPEELVAAFSIVDAAPMTVFNSLVRNAD